MNYDDVPEPTGLDPLKAPFEEACRENQRLKINDDEDWVVMNEDVESDEDGLSGGYIMPSESIESIDIESSQTRTTNASLPPMEASLKSPHSVVEGKTLTFGNAPPTATAQCRRALRMPEDRETKVMPVAGTGGPPPTPTYHLIDDSDDVELRSGEESGSSWILPSSKRKLSPLTKLATMPTSNPHVNVNPPAFSVDRGDGRGFVTRKVWGLPMV